MSVASAINPRADAASFRWQGRRATHLLPFSWMGQTIRSAAREGIDLTGSLRTAGLDAQVSMSPDAHLDPAESMLLFMLLVNAVDDELHGLTRTRMSRGTVSMGAKATASATTLLGAITILCRFYDMIGSVCRFSFESSPREAILTVSMQRGDTGQGALVEELLAHSALLQLSHFFGDILPLTRFTTSSPLHPSAGAMHPYFLCPVVASTTTSIVFSPTLLAARSRAITVDYPLWEAARFWLARHPATREPVFDSDPQRPAASALLAVLKQADLPISTCSSELGLSLSDLRNRLASGSELHHHQPDVVAIGHASGLA